ncbi:MAG: phosphatidate cytidylyltransferase [Micrococcales bacterium]|nr:phosphatidate cytidylyltransferase [Micrococcales bacterium]NBR61218.1 phosphatidate cytidylyltransferase [Actinomycetota bacterium]NBY43464.1 phosphatidate cytidylyltransferase [Micrococcales bacterium]
MSQTEAKGRSLSQSVIYGLLLAFAFLASVLFVQELFIALIALGSAAGAWELSSALRQKDWHVPRLPVSVGSAAVMPLTYYGGEKLQWLGVLAIVALLMIWRVFELLLQRKSWERSFAELIRDFSASAFVVVYLPLTMSFAALIMAEPEHDGNVAGKFWIITIVTTVILVDSSAYLFGRKLGKHPMLPKVSPKKSWEGFFISALFAVASTLVQTPLLLHLPIWFALVIAFVVLMAAVLGDFAESLIKRDLGVKDMSSWIPGHGGVMDRLDSMLPACLAGYLLMVFAVRFI